MSDYRSPIKDALFALRHIGMLDDLAKTERFSHADPETVASVLEEHGRFMQEVFAPLNASGDREGLTWTPRGRHDPGGVQAGLRQVRRGRVAGLQRRPGVRRCRLPRGRLRLAAMESMIGANGALAMAPGLTTGAIDLPPGVGHRGAEGDLPPQDDHRRVDRHDEPDRAAGRLRRRSRPPPGRCPRTTAATGSPARRSSSRSASTTWPRTSSTSSWPAPPSAPPGPRASRCSSCPKFLVERRRHARRAQRRQCVSIEHKMGIHASPTCVMSLRRRGRCGRVPGRRGEPGHAGHVHDDERRPHRRGRPGRRPR